MNPLDAAPRRILSRKVYHTGNPRRSLLDFADPAVTEGRYHSKGGSGVWYASFRERGAWAEVFRHHESAEISPFEVRRRVWRARTHELVVLNLTKRSVQMLLQLTNDDIAGESYETCRRLAESARAAGFDGMLVKTPESVMTTSFLFLFPLTFASCIFVDPATMPAWLQTVVDLNPVTHLAGASRGLMHGGIAMIDIAWVFAASAAIVAVFAPLAMRMYGRER